PQNIKPLMPFRRILTPLCIICDLIDCETNRPLGSVIGFTHPNHSVSKPGSNGCDLLSIGSLKIFALFSSIFWSLKKVWKPIQRSVERNHC
ncbi:MAG: hypothetical protein ACOCUT_02625, partial [bacterium]